MDAYARLPVVLVLRIYTMDGGNIISYYLITKSTVA